MKRFGSVATGLSITRAMKDPTVADTKRFEVSRTTLTPAACAFPWRESLAVPWLLTCSEKYENAIESLPPFTVATGIL